MSTRAEQVEACRIIGPACANAHPDWDQERIALVASASATLTRDGELRERLAKLVEKGREPNIDHTHMRGITADELSALLQEFA